MFDLKLHAAAEADPTGPAGIEVAVLALRDYFSRVNPGQQCLLLVDPQPGDVPARSQGKHSLAALPRTTLPMGHGAFPVPHRPYLLTLDPKLPQFGAWLAESMRVALADRRPDSIASTPGQRIGGWLATTTSAEEVAKHLSAHVLQTDDRGKTCALRFYDSRALALLWPVLMLMQQETLLGPIKAWHALDAGAHLKSYAGLYPPVRDHLALKPEQWAAIRRHGLINRALALHVNATGRQPEPQALEAAVAAAARSERYRLADRDDTLAFIGHALSWHPHFDSHPRVSRALQNLSPDYPYMAAASELSADEIDSVRSGEWCRGRENDKHGLSV
jgi:hypothetical protein